MTEIIIFKLTKTNEQQNHKLICERIDSWSEDGRAMTYNVLDETVEIIFTDEAFRVLKALADKGNKSLGEYARSMFGFE